MLKDVSRVVSSSAYLLFYRRRSDKPLGGPRFQEIFNKFDNVNEASEDEESGEDQGLVGDSSQPGSSRALTGVGAARRANGSQLGAKTMTTNPKDHDDELPDYSRDDDDEMPMLDFGERLRQSVEDDEGVDMSMGYNDNNRLSQATGTSWTFDNLNVNSRPIVSGAGSDAASNASDAVNADSSASETSKQNRIMEFEDAPAEDDIDIPYEDQSYVPDMDEDAQAAAIGLQHDLIETMHYPAIQQYEDERLEVEEPATDIILEDNDDLKMD